MAFIYVVDGQLPKIAYSTWMHLYMGLCFGTVFLTMIVVVVADSFGASEDNDDEEEKNDNQNENEDPAASQPLLPAGQEALTTTKTAKKTTSCCCGRFTRDHARTLFQGSKAAMPLLFVFCAVLMTIEMSVSAQSRAYEMVQRETQVTVAGTR